jgi:hypothetical protein
MVAFFEGFGLLLQLLGSNSFGALQVGAAQIGFRAARYPVATWRLLKTVPMKTHMVAKGLP